MVRPKVAVPDILARFPLPLPSLGAEIRSTPEDLAESAKDVLAIEATWGLGESVETHLHEFTVAPVGQLLIASGRTTPVALQFKPVERVTVMMCYGGSSLFSEGCTQLRSLSGGLLVFPSTGGTLCGGFHAGISFSLERDRLLRTARAILGRGSIPALEAPFLIQGPSAAGPRQGLMFSLFRHLDHVFRQDRDLPTSLALDDQIYRTLVHAFAREFQLQPLACRGAKGAGWSAALDDLVDYIRVNSHRHLTLTDLEEHSHYSARHLQSLFREKFACTPMQYVRRQRLSAAMERLQISRDGASVTRIARECGYRFTSNFTADFQREFGVTPSMVLREPRWSPPPPAADG